ncbi:MAG: gamma-glutamyl-gamma-aminobutyrate hydrolase family protein, partial [Desulfovibrionaceae bacterium]|nr:gamma-glutamyl-gamma-aminobutyrate hydrolase family protein [Desulfovibrionaceae bacterium]
AAVLGQAPGPAGPAAPAPAAVKRPVIGITAGLMPPDVSSGHAGPEREYQNADYVAAVIAAGGTPLILPLSSDAAVIRQHMELIDGLLVAGGPDINPLLYHEEPMPATEDISAERDTYDLEAIRIAAELNKPVFGVCRGLQAMNVAFGGTLYQDVSLHGPVVKHSQKAKRDVATITVQVAPNTLTATLLKEKTVTVNSFHHQSVKTPAQGFVVSAQSADGIVEAMENPKYRFMLGVQWHPEGMAQTRPDMLGLFKAFVDAARKY